MTPNDSVQTIPDTNNARLAHSVIPNFGSNYVREGFRLVADWEAGELSVGRGRALTVHDGTVYHAQVDDREDADTLTIPAGTNGVWYKFDAKTMSVGSDPGEPSLKIGEVDAAAETVDETVNRARNETFGATEIESINSTVWVSPDDDWHERVGDENDPISNARVFVMPGEHVTQRRTLIGDNVVIEGVGDATISKPTPVTVDLAADVSSGDSTIQVADGSQFEVGRGVYIEDGNAHQREDATQTHITDISGDTLTLNEPTRGSYSTSANATCSQTHSLLSNGVDFNDPSVSGSNANIHVRDLHLHGGGRTAAAPSRWTIALCYFHDVTGGSIRDCTLEEHHGDGISDQRGTSREIQNNTVQQIDVHPIHIGLGSSYSKVDNNLCRNSTGTGVYTSTNIEGVEITNNEIVDCEGDVSPHGTPAGGIGDFTNNNNNCLIEGNFIDLRNVTARGFQGAGTTGNRFISNTVLVNDDRATDFGSISDYTFRDNRIRVTNSAGGACLRIYSGDGIRIVDNHLESQAAGSVYCSAGTHDTVVRGNTLDTPGSASIFVAGTGTADNWTISENTMVAGNVFINSGVDDSFEWIVRDNVDKTSAGSSVGVSISSSTRLIRNGWGTNSGDPSSTGQWNGNGREGVNVYDTTNAVKYAYVNGGWR